MFPGYTRVALLHASARHRVWQAVREADGAAVLLKVPAAERPTQHQLAALAREHHILERLADASAVGHSLGLLRFGAGRAALLLEPAGEPLNDYVARLGPPGEAPLDALLALGIAIAEALAQLHARELVHKNLQPGNVLVDAQGRVRLIDFRIASELAAERLADGLSSQALQWEEAELAYVSPEQTGRTNRQLDYRADFYALGVLLYELLTGRLPLQADSALGWVHAHISQPVRPPELLRSGLPPVLSAIELKLLAKNPEERYQSSVGLIEDLARCRRELAAGGGVSQFELGRRDVSPRLRLSGRLYGREAEVAALTALFEQVAAGGNEIVMVSGPSGIGKSALVGELDSTLVRRNGVFVRGKFDQFQRGTPYAAVATALRGLVQQWLAAETDARQAWRARVLAALGANAQVLVELLPELQTLLGAQPPVPVLPAAEAQNRFQLALIDFVRCVAAAQPLVLFIDDLQFADGATLHLLRWLAAARDLPQLLLVGAYRSNEVPPTHALALALDDIRETRPLHGFELAALDRDAVERLLGDTLHAAVDDVRPLAELLHQRAQGNPYFLTELLRALVHQRALRFAPELGRWRWELRAVREAELAGSVVELVLEHLRRLPPQTQLVLQRAACIGTRFELRTLAAVCELPPAQTAAALQPALRALVLAPMDESYRLVGHGLSEEAEANPAYRFQHDRAQQAAYTLTDPSTRPALHLAVGRLLRSLAGATPTQEQRIDIVGHLNQGRALLADPAERLELAQRNLEAGRIAQRAAAYEAGLGYLSTGQELLPPDAWHSQHELAMALATERQQCSYLTGRNEEAEQWLEQLLAHARTPLQRAEILAMRTRQYATTGRMEDSMRAAIAGLELLGVRFEARPTEADLKRERAAVQRRLRGRPIASLATAPPLQDPQRQVELRLLMEIFPAAFLSGSGTLFPYLVLRAVRLSLTHGTGPESAFAYAAYAMLLCGTLDDPAQGWAFSQLALQINEELDDIALKSRVMYLNTMFVHHWSRPWKTMTPMFRRGLEAGYQSGDLLYLAYNAQDCVIWDPTLPLAQAEHEHAELMQVVHDTGYQDSFDSGSLFLQMQRCLLGRTRGPLQLDDDSFDEARVLAGMQQRRFATGVANFHIYKAEIAWLHAAPAEALTHVQALQALRASAMSLPQLVRLYLLTTLVFGHHLPQLDDADGLRRLLKEDLQRMRRWARHCAENFAHLAAFMEAEILRLDGRPLRALQAYERGAALAREGGWQRDEAMLLEAAGRLLLSLQRSRAAEGYLRAAHDTFERWGAIRKVALLRGEFPLLAGAEAAAAAPPDLDLLSVMKASRVIAGEIVLETLWTRTMRVMLENAGAQRGCFIVQDEGQLLVQGLCTPEGEEAVSRNIEETARQLPITLITQVLQTREPIILADARQDSRFARDLYLRGTPVQSLLCIPLRRQGRFEGAVYMENRIASGVFTSERIGVLELLAAQASISIENARLVAAQQRLIQAQRRFVPSEFLQSLDRHDIASVDPGENVAKLMSVMFSDLRGFTPIAERLEPRGVISLLNRYFTAMGRPIKSAGGFIDGFAGDEIKALFDTDSDAAIAAAVGMWRELEAFNVEQRAHGQPELRMGVGLATGAVVLGTVGGSERLQCSVVGDTVNLASRIEQLTKRYGARVLCVGASVDALRNPERWHLRLVDRVAVKGRDTAVRLYEVLEAESAEVAERRIAALPAFEAAFEAYMARDFGRARKGFAALAAADPEDLAPTLLAARCEQFLYQPPPPGWDGTERLTEK